MRHPHQPSSRERRRHPGEFTAQRARHQRMAQRHARILAAVAEVRIRGEAYLTLDGYELKLTNDIYAAAQGPSGFGVIVRTRTMGLRLGFEYDKGRGWVELHNPDGTQGPVIGLARNQTLAYVAEMTKVSAATTQAA